MQQTVGSCVGLYDALADSLYICIQQAVRLSVAHTCTLQQWLLQYRQYCCSRTSAGLANLWHAAFSAVPFFISFARPPSLYCEQHLYIYTYLLRTDCIWITVPTKRHCSETFLHKKVAVRSVGWIFIVGALYWRCLGKYVTLDRTFYGLLLKQEAAAAAQLLPHFVTYRIPRRDIF